MKLFKSCLIAISIPLFSFSQNSIDNNQIGGIKEGMGIAAMKKIYPTYKFKVYEPDGNGAGDWRNQGADISTLEIFKPNSNTTIYSILLQDKKVGSVDYSGSDFKIKEGIGIGSSLQDLRQASPKLYVSLIGGFDNITQKESIVITAASSAYPNLQFCITSTPELDRMDVDKVDRSKLPPSLKVYKISLVSSDANKAIFEDANLLPSNKIELTRQEDKHAAYPGGDEALRNYMRNIRYPKEAQEKGIQGTVYIKFFVDENGKIINPTPITHLGGGLEEEGLRLVKSMPNWLPAIKDGKPVKEELNLPFRFSRQ